MFLLRVFVLLGLIIVLISCVPSTNNISFDQSVVPKETSPSANPTTNPAVQSNTNVPAIQGVFGSSAIFATHTELEKYGFSFGPSDGQFGAIPVGGTNYIFYGDAGSNSSCQGTPRTKGAFSFNL